MKKLVLKKCAKCGAVVEILHDCTCENCGVKCCGEQMKEIMPNVVDASMEKHIPQYEIVDDEIIVKVDHAMDEEHYIEWIAMVDDRKIGKKFLKPGEKAVVTFPYCKGSTLYAYCNKHELWSKEVE